MAKTDQKVRWCPRPKPGEFMPCPECGERKACEACKVRIKALVAEVEKRERMGN